jgi:hypothetical protein
MICVINNCTALSCLGLLSCIDVKWSIYNTVVYHALAANVQIKEVDTYVHYKDMLPNGLHDVDAISISYVPFVFTRPLHSHLVQYSLLTFS